MVTFLIAATNRKERREGGWVYFGSWFKGTDHHGRESMVAVCRLQQFTSSQDAEVIAAA